MPSIFNNPKPGSIKDRAIARLKEVHEPWQVDVALNGSLQAIDQRFIATGMRILREYAILIDQLHQL